MKNILRKQSQKTRKTGLVVAVMKGGAIVGHLPVSKAGRFAKV